MCAPLLLSQALPAPLSRACARSDSKSALPPRQHSASSSSRPHRGSLHETRDERRIPGRRATPTGAAGPVPRWHSPAPTPGHTCTRNSLSSERRIASRYGAQRFALFLRIRPFLVLCTSSCDARFSTSPHKIAPFPQRAACLCLGLYGADCECFSCRRHSPTDDLPSNRHPPAAPPPAGRRLRSGQLFVNQ